MNDFDLYCVMISIALIYGVLPGLVLTTVMAVFAQKVRDPMRRLIAVIGTGFGIAGILFAIALLTNIFFGSCGVIPVHFGTGFIDPPACRLLCNLMLFSMMSTAIIVPPIILQLFNRPYRLWQVAVCTLIVYALYTLETRGVIQIPLTLIIMVSAPVIGIMHIENGMVATSINLFFAFFVYLALSIIIYGIILGLTKFVVRERK